MSQLTILVSLVAALALTSCTGCGSQSAAVSPATSSVGTVPAAAVPAPQVTLTPEEQKVVDFIAVKLPTLRRVLSLQDDALELAASGQYSASLDKMRKYSALCVATADEWGQIDYARGNVTTMEALFERALKSLRVSGKILIQAVMGEASDNDAYRAVQASDRARKAIDTLEKKIDRLKSNPGSAAEM